MNEKEAVNVFELVRKDGNLPARLEDLVPLSFIGAAAVKFYKAKVQVMKELGMADAQQKATLADGQDAAECLLRIEAKIGELYEKLPDTQKEGGRRGAGRGRQAEIEGTGIGHQRAISAVKIAKHPKVVDEIIAQAKENEDLPTRTAVLNKIAYDEDKKYKENVRLETTREMNAGEISYLIALDQAYNLIAKAPRQITEAGHKAIIDSLQKIAAKVEEMLHDQAPLLE